METRRTVVLGDPQAMVRDGLKAVLEGTQRFRVVGEVDSPHEAVQCARQLSPDIVVLALEMPGTNTLQAIRELASIKPQPRVLAVVDRESREILKHVIEAGATGCVCKTRSATDLVTAADYLASGRMYLPYWASRLMHDLVRAARTGPETRLATLTSTERRVLELTARGFTSREIGPRVFLAPKSVDNARSRVRRKLGLKTRADLVAFAVRAGLLTSEE